MHFHFVEAFSCSAIHFSLQIYASPLKFVKVWYEGLPMRLQILLTLTKESIKLSASAKRCRWTYQTTKHKTKTASCTSVCTPMFTKHVSNNIPYMFKQLQNLRHLVVIFHDIKGALLAFCPASQNDNIVTWWQLDWRDFKNSHMLCTATMPFWTPAANLFCTSATIRDWESLI